MKTYTNMAWPDDQFRTGQQLYRRPAPRLAAFTVAQAMEGSHGCPYAFAVVYLPLHRTQTLAVTEQSLAFGFRAASIGCGTEVPDIVRLADLDLMQARRHAAVLAGYRLADDLNGLQSSTHDDDVLRGVAAVADEWAHRRAQTRGTAAMFDCGLDLSNATSLAEACECSSISPPTTRCFAPEDGPVSQEDAAAVSVERALAIAMVSARHLGRYMWEGTLQTEELTAANAWDCFPSRPADHKRSVPDSRRE